MRFSKKYKNKVRAYDRVQTYHHYSQILQFIKTDLSQKLFNTIENNNNITKLPSFLPNPLYVIEKLNFYFIKITSTDNKSTTYSTILLRA